MNKCPSCSAPTDDGNRYCPSCGKTLAPPGGETELLPAHGDSNGAGVRIPESPTQSPPIEGRFIPGALLAGRYRLVALLGRGGMGEVYRAEDTRLGQTVALKFLPDALAQDRESLERFYAEVRIGRQVSHPNVCRIYDLIEVDGLRYLTMEYVDGEDLATLLKRIGRLPTDKGIAIAREIGAGLAAAHDKGVIHRDLKPANVMIDGKGRARITDFGIAALADDVAREASAGTPAYMAPEQLHGAPASVQSDIYSLGLVFYETFTGQRRFEARTLDELKSLHASAQPASLSSSARDIPSDVERIVQCCLETDPSRRPVSVHAVLAALPGGDPLAAALAAGETPSPAMVAAAGRVGDLSATVAWCLLLLTMAALFALDRVSLHTSILALSGPERPPEVLVERARELLIRDGLDPAPVDSAHGFGINRNYLNYVATHDARPGRWQHIADARPGAMLFYYRQSPIELVAVRTALSPYAPADVGHVTQQDPPTLVPGMADVTLDRFGRLVNLRAVPPAEATPGPYAEPDWSALLADAGLVGGKLVSVAPRLAAPVDSDRKAAWNASYPGQPDIEIHVEAATYRGKPVWFDLKAPWTRPPSPIPLVPPVTMVILVGFSLLSTTAMVVLSRRNLRLGRGDRVGAFRLAMTLCIASTLALLLRADHVAELFSETSLIINLLAQTGTYAFAAWLNYLALEPIVRRRWPQLLVGWSRLLDGRVRDPLVARDALVGALLGSGLALTQHLAVLAPAWLTGQAVLPWIPGLSTLGSLRQVGYLLLMSPYTSVVFGLGNLFAVILLQALLRNRVLALLVQFALTYTACLVMTAAPQASWSPAAAVFAAIWLAVLLRSGLLAAIVGFYVFMVLDSMPLPLSAASWYAGGTGLVFAALALLLLLAFRQSLAGKPMLGHLLDRDADL